MSAARYPRVLVTGASRGLGAALSARFASLGHRVLMAARDGAELMRRAESLRAAGAQVETCAVDLSQRADCARLAAQAQQLMGGVDVLVNNAAIGPYRPFLDNDDESLEQLLALNLAAPMRLARAVLPGMLAQRRGWIINVASDLARRPLANMAPYVASKYGLLGFGASLHRELRASGIRVCSVLPGIIDSSFNGATEGSKEARWAMKTEPLAARIADLLSLPDELVIDEFAIHPVEGDY